MRVEQNLSYFSTTSALTACGDSGAFRESVKVFHSARHRLWSIMPNVKPQCHRLARVCAYMLISPSAPPPKLAHDINQSVCQLITTSKASCSEDRICWSHLLILRSLIIKFCRFVSEGIACDLGLPVRNHQLAAKTSTPCAGECPSIPFLLFELFERSCPICFSNVLHCVWRGLVLCGHNKCMHHTANDCPSLVILLFCIFRL